VELIPAVSFGLLGTTPPLRSPEITLIEATSTPRIPLADATVTLRLNASDPRSSSFTFSGNILSFISANFRVSFDGNVSVQGGVNVPGLGTANLPAINFNIGQLFANVAPSSPPPLPPAAPSGYSPALRITSVTRTTDGRGAVVSFQGSTIDPASAVARFNYSDGRAVATVNLASPGSGQTFNRSNGIGSFTISDVVTSNLILPTFSLRGSIQDRLASSSSDLFGPILVVPPSYTPTVQITGTAREPDGRLRIDFLASSIDSFPTFQFENNTPQRSGNRTVSPTTTFLTFNTTFPSSSRVYNSITGRGFVIVADPQETTAAGRPFTILATVRDRFASGRSAAFGPVSPLISTPLTVSAPSALDLAIGSTTTAFASVASRYRIADPVRGSGADSMVTLVIRSETPSVTFTLSRPLPSGIEVESERSDGRYLIVRGRVGQVNSVVDALNVTRVNASAGELRFFAYRSDTQNDLSGSVDRSITIAGIPIAIVFPRFNESPRANQLPTNPLGTQLFGRTTIQSQQLFFVRASISVRRLDGSVGSERIALQPPLISSVVVRSSNSGRTLDLSGFGTREQYEDLLNRFTFTSTGPRGDIAFDIRLVDASERIFTTTYQRLLVVTGTAGQTAEGEMASEIADDPFPGLTIRTNSPDVYDGTGPSALFPNLVAGNDTGNSVRSASVAFTGFYDSTSDRLLFEPVGDITGDFDIATGVLTLTAGPTASLADFESTLRSVRFDSLRQNAMNPARQITATLFTDFESSEPEFGTVFVPMMAPTVPPMMMGTTDPIVAAPDGTPVPMFADMTMTDPDAAMPAPDFVMGEFMMGSTMTRGTVQIANHVPGEDFLTFTSVGGLTGHFNDETGELSFFGQGTMAEWQQVMQSVMYENRNAAPTPGERTIVVTMDDGSASGNPPTMTRTLRVMDDGERIERDAGVVNPLNLAPGATATSIGLAGLGYTPRPGEPTLVFTILAAPGDGQGTVLLADGTPAVAGTDVTLDQLRGATFAPNAVPAAGTVPFSFQVVGLNAVTGHASEPLIETVEIRTANAAPVAVPDSFMVLSDRPLAIGLAGNDTDANGEPLVVASFTQPANGTVATDDGVTFTFTPNAGFVGTDTFEYTVRDAAGATSRGVASLRVQPSAETANRVGTPDFAVGTDVGGATASLVGPDGTPRFTVTPFGGFTGGIRTATADFTGDGVTDLVVGTGPGTSNQVKIIDGATQKELIVAQPFEASFTGGVFVAAGDLDGDGLPELVVTPDVSGGPRVLVYRGTDFSTMASFFGIDDPNFRGGARVAIGDVNGDGMGDLVVAAGFGGGPRVAGFDGASLATVPTRVFNDFFAFEQTLRNGVYVAVGDTDGDGFADVIAGAGPDGGPRVVAYDAMALLGGSQEFRANFFAGDPANRGGVRVAVKNLDRDGRADLIAGDAANPGGRVTSYVGISLSSAGQPPVLAEFDAFDSVLAGVFVG
jgi:Bacterial Ig domain/FG-GAP-like repeat